MWLHLYSSVAQTRGHNVNTQLVRGFYYLLVAGTLLTSACAQKREPASAAKSNNSVIEKIGEYFKETAATGTAEAVPSKRSVTFEVKYKDQTGSVFETRREEILLGEDDELITINGKAYRKQDLVKAAELGVVGLESVSAQKTTFSGPDAQGVIVKLKGAPVAEQYGNALGRGKSHSAAAMEARQRGLEIAQQHASAKSKIQAALGMQLIDQKSRPTKKQSRVQDLSVAANAIAVLDVGVKVAKEKLRNIEEVESIEPNRIMHAVLFESVPMTQAPEVWKIAGTDGKLVDGTGMRIGIIDTGVDYHHPDLGGCFGSTCKVAGGYDFVNNDSDPLDDQGHGTHVAATAAGLGTDIDSTGKVTLYRGTAPGAKIYAYKVLDRGGSGSESVIVKAIERCADPNQDGIYNDRLDVCSMSLGGQGTPDSVTSLAVDRITTLGVLFTIAAGNSGPDARTIQAPGASRKALTVAAACKASQIGSNSKCTTPIASFSSRGPVVWTDANGAQQTLAKPDIAAPGVLICAAQWGDWLPTSVCGPKRIAISGTSMATPHMAGIAALIRQLKPTLAPDQVKQVLMNTARSLGEAPEAQGKGMVDAYAAAQAVGVSAPFLSFDTNFISVVDQPTTKLQSYSRTLTVTNVSGAALTLSTSFLSAKSGVTGQSSPSSFTLAPQESKTISVSIALDHGLTGFPSYADAQVNLVAGTRSVSIPVGIVIKDPITIEQTEFDLGYRLPNSSSSKSFAITLRNSLMDGTANYTVGVDCCIYVFGPFAVPTTLVTATPDKSAISVGPGQTSVLNVTVSAGNLGTVSDYYGSIRLTAGMQSRDVQFQFYNGYAVRLVYDSDPLPELAATMRQTPLGNTIENRTYGDTNDRIIIKPPRDSIIKYESPDTLSVVSRWEDPAYSLGVTHVSDWNKHTTNALLEVHSSKAAANFRITNSATSPSGGSLSPGLTGLWVVSDGFSGVKTVSARAGGTGSVGLISKLPSDVQFEASTISDTTSATMDQINIQDITLNGISGDVNVTSTSSDWIQQNVRGFDNRVNDSLKIVPQMVLQWDNKVNANASAIAHTPGAIKKLNVLNPKGHDIGDKINYKMPRFVLFNLALVGSSGNTYARTPNLYYFGDRQIASLDAQRDLPESIFNKDKYIDAQRPPVLNLGAGPFFDAGRMDSSMLYMNWMEGNWGMAYSLYADSQNNIADAFVRTTSYRIYLNGAVKADYPYSGFGGYVYSAYNDPGNYNSEIRAVGNINGTQVSLLTELSWKVPDTAALAAAGNQKDTSPPGLESVRLLSGGVDQPIVFENVSNELVFILNPVPGVKVMSDGHYMPLATDTLSSVKAEVSYDNGTSWSVMTVASAGTNRFRAAIPLRAGTPLYSFRISAADATGNTFRHTLQIPGATSGGVQSGAADVLNPVAVLTNPTPWLNWFDWNAPAPYPILTGAVNFTAAAWDDVGLDRVVFSVDGKVVSTLTAAPFQLNFNTSSLADGRHMVDVRAYDKTGKYSNLSRAYFDTKNFTPDTSAPTVAITSPTSGSFVSGTVAINVNASDDRGVTQVNISVNGTSLCSKTAAPYTCDWTAPSVRKQTTYTIAATARDAAGNTQTFSTYVYVAPTKGGGGRR